MGGARRDYGQYAGAARNAYQVGASDLRQRDEAMRAGDLQTRQQDIGLATDQARLEAGQRAEDAANRRYFLNLENATKFGVMNAENGNTDTAFNQGLARNAEERAQDAASMQRTKDTVGLVGAVGSGAVTGGATPSDVKAKEPVTWGSLAPITWGAPMTAAAEQQRKRAEGGDDSGSDRGSDKNSKKPGESSEDWPSGRSPFEAEQPPRDTIGAYDKNAGLYRADPYGSGEVYQGDPSDREANIFRGNPYGRPREMMYSDEAAKQAAYVAGFNQARSMGDSKNEAEVPGSETKGTPEGDKVEKEVKAAADKKSATSEFNRRQDELGQLAGTLTGHSYPAALTAGNAMREAYGPPTKENAEKVANTTEYLNALTGHPYAVIPAAAKLDAATGGYGKRAVDAASKAVGDWWSRATAPKSGYGAGPAGPAFPDNSFTYSDKRAKTSCYSDEETKERFGDMPKEAMKGAMRSMEPHPYAYKVEFAARSGQEPGEVNVGPMAQSMAKDPVARTVVERDPDTGMMALDKDKMLKLLGGSLAVLQSEIDDIHDGPRAKGANGSRRGRAA